MTANNGWEARLRKLAKRLQPADTIRLTSSATGADLSRALSEIEALRKCVDCIHGDLGLFKMAIAAEDPKAELLTRVKMIEEHINRARIEGKEPHS